MEFKCIVEIHASDGRRLQYLIGILLSGLIVAPFAAYSNEQMPLFDDEYTVQKYVFAPISAMSSEEADEYVGKSQWFYHGAAGGALYQCDGGFDTSHKVLTKAEVYAYDPVHKELGLNGNEFRLTTLKCGDRRWTWEIISTVDDGVVYYGLDGVLFKLVRISGLNNGEKKNKSAKSSNTNHGDEITKPLVDKADEYYDEGKYVEAQKLYRKAAEQGVPVAQNTLGSMYEEGLGGLLQSYKTAMRLYRKAAGQGNADAQYNIGLLYQEGLGVKKNHEKSILWFAKAAEQFRKDALQGDAFAQRSLGNMYYNGEGGLKKNYAAAMKWYRKAADQGNAWAQHDIAVFYMVGQGVEKDYLEAANWCIKAAEQGDAEAQNTLGQLYDVGGYGLPRSSTKAQKWYRKAAEQGHADAQNMLGVLQGTGGRGQVALDFSNIQKWRREVAEREHSDEPHMRASIEEGEDTPTATQLETPDDQIAALYGLWSQGSPSCDHTLTIINDQSTGKMLVGGKDDNGNREYIGTRHVYASNAKYVNRRELKKVLVGDFNHISGAVLLTVKGRSGTELFVFEQDIGDTAKVLVVFQQAVTGWRPIADTHTWYRCD